MVLTWGESRGEHLKLDVLAPPPLLDEPTPNESEMEMGGAEMHVRTDGRTDVRHSSEERSRSGEETLYLHT